MEIVPAVKSLLTKAEISDDTVAVALYEQVLNLDDFNEKAYNRLMILYRKLKDYKKEIMIIDKAIKSFEKHFRSRNKQSKKVEELSAKLNKAVGLIDKRGNEIYDPEPIATWKKRKLAAEKKLLKSASSQKK